MTDQGPIVDEMRGIRAELKAIRRLLEHAIEPEAEAPTCPECGSEDIQDTGTFGRPRVTCLACGKSAQPENAEVVLG